MANLTPSYYTVRVYHNGEAQPQIEWSNVSFANNSKTTMQQAIGFAVIHTMEEYYTATVEVFQHNTGATVIPAHDYKPIIKGKPTNVIVTVEQVASK